VTFFEQMQALPVVLFVWQASKCQSVGVYALDLVVVEPPLVGAPISPSVAECQTARDDDEDAPENCPLPRR
jgi:hypothetical protein